MEDNPWNSNTMTLENEMKLETSMRRNDMFDAIVTRELPNGRLQILGGSHRNRIAKRIGMKVPVIVLKGIDDDRAKEISLAHNSRYGSDDSLKLSELINSLDNADILSEILPYSELEIEALMSAASVDLDSLDLEILDDDLDAPEEPVKASKTHTIMRFKVPVQDAAEIQNKIDATIKAQGFTESDTLTNAGDALVHLLLSKGV